MYSPLSVASVWMRQLVALDVGVHDGDHLAAALCEAALHGCGLREERLVPREVALSVRVLDVEPQHVVGEGVLLELGVDGGDVGFVLVIPAALVVAKGEAGRHGLRPGHGRVLAEHLSGRGARHDREVEHARLGHPASAGARRVLGDVDKGLGGVVPEHAGSPALAVGDHDRDGAVESHRVMQLVLEHVEVVEPVRLCVRSGLGRARGRGAEGEGVGVLGNAVHVGAAGEGSVHAHRGGAMGAVVSVAAKGLGPHALLGLGIAHQLRAGSVALALSGGGLGARRVVVVSAVGVDGLAVLAPVKDTAAGSGRAAAERS